MHVETVSKVPSGNRKVSKSAMEKKRRARINTSVSELKTMLSNLLKLQGERFDKLEKADILEMTVNYIKKFQYQSYPDKKEIKGIPSTYDDGFTACVREVDQYVGTDNTDLKTRILTHLADRVTGNDTHKHAHDDVRRRRETVKGVTKSVSSLSKERGPLQISPDDVRVRGVQQSSIEQNTPITVNCTIPDEQTDRVTHIQQPSLVSQSYSNPSVAVTQPLSVTPQQANQQTVPGALQYVSCFVQNGQLSFLLPTNVIPQQVPVLTSPVNIPMSMSPLLVANSYQSPSTVPYAVDTAQQISMSTSQSNATPIGVCLPQQIICTNTNQTSPNDRCSSPSDSDACSLPADSVNKFQCSNQTAFRHVDKNPDSFKHNTFADQNNNTLQYPPLKCSNESMKLGPNHTMFGDQRQSSMWRPW